VTAAPRAPIGGAVELLDRALAYTRGALLTVTSADLSRRTPCTAWSLDQLLAHMDDALDTFTEAATGRVYAEVDLPLSTRIDVLQLKACSLLGAWSGPAAPATVQIADVELPTEVVVLAAALEITVHGWDVGVTTGRGAPIPRDLAAALTPVARTLVDDADREHRFAPPRPVEAGAPADDLLLAWCGRHLTGPPTWVSPVRSPRARSAS